MIAADMELEEGNPDFQPVIDRRLRLPEPLPVRLIAVGDVHLPAWAGVEAAMDHLYCKILEFERLALSRVEWIYRADNFDLRFELQSQPVEHDSLRPQGIEVQSLPAVEKRLIEAQIEYMRQNSVTPGQQSLLVVDPAGNWLEISEFQRIM